MFKINDFSNEFGLSFAQLAVIVATEVFIFHLDLKIPKSVVE